MTHAKTGTGKRISRHRKATDSIPQHARQQRVIGYQGPMADSFADVRVACNKWLARNEDFRREGFNYGSAQKR